MPRSATPAARWIPLPRVLLVAAAVALASGSAAAQGRPDPEALPRPPALPPTLQLPTRARPPGPALAPVDPDPWVGRDKGIHLCATAALAGAGYGLGAIATDGVAGRIAIGAALALGAGAGKEALDAAGFGTPSLRDLLWDVIGATFGLALALSVDVAARPASFGTRLR